MSTLLMEDLGPDFIAWRAEVGGRAVCLATPRVLTDPQVRRDARHMIESHGGSCAECRACPIGQLEE